MNRPEEPNAPKETKPARADEALRIIEEYAKSLREIIKKLRGKLNSTLG